jgi:hypothetical protein
VIYRERFCVLLSPSLSFFLGHDFLLRSWFLLVSALSLASSFALSRHVCPLYFTLICLAQSYDAYHSHFKNTLVVQFIQFSLHELTKGTRYPSSDSFHHGITI